MNVYSSPASAIFKFIGSHKINSSIEWIHVLGYVLGKKLSLTWETTTLFSPEKLMSVPSIDKAVNGCHLQVAQTIEPW